jgi:hypothetical protein
MSCAAALDNEFIIPAGCCSIPIDYRGLYDITVKASSELTRVTVWDGASPSVICKSEPFTNTIHDCQINENYTLEICQSNPNITAAVYFDKALSPLDVFGMAFGAVALVIIVIFVVVISGCKCRNRREMEREHTPLFSSDATR